MKNIKTMFQFQSKKETPTILELIFITYLRSAFVGNKKLLLVLHINLFGRRPHAGILLHFEPDQSSFLG